ncbi:hypothetical protein AAG570_007692 [Ranatra chinensis]|uniref:Cyclin-dependent kinase inhibitor domain-containing protein n=1 Tax=Ranatra chinensis TaxID=642074 RepID=A0ABD0Y9J1_9HEMI
MDQSVGSRPHASIPRSASLYQHAKDQVTTCLVSSDGTMKQDPDKTARRSEAQPKPKKDMRKRPLIQRSEVFRARRALDFGPESPANAPRVFEEAMRAEVRRQSDTWGFDFVNCKPLEGIWVWEEVAVRPEDADLTGDEAPDKEATDDPDDKDPLAMEHCDLEGRS